MPFIDNGIHINAEPGVFMGTPFRGASWGINDLKTRNMRLCKPECQRYPIPLIYFMNGEKLRQLRDHFIHNSLRIILKFTLSMKNTQSLPNNGFL